MLYFFVFFFFRELWQAGGQEEEVNAHRGGNGGSTAGHQSHGQQRQSDAGQADGHRQPQQLAGRKCQSAAAEQRQQHAGDHRGRLRLGIHGCPAQEEGPHHLHGPPDLRAGEAVRGEEVSQLQRAHRHGQAADGDRNSGRTILFLKNIYNIKSIRFLENINKKGRI